MTIPRAVGGKLASELRARFAEADFVRYTRIDLARYEHLDAPPMADLVAIFEGLASEVTSRSLSLVSARVLRLSPGDYLLVRHDRIHQDRPIELVLDLSPMSVPDADVHWRHRGQVFFSMPSMPGALSLVERGGTVTSNHKYVTKRWRGPPIVRLVGLLRDRSSEGVEPASPS